MEVTRINELRKGRHKLVVDMHALLDKPEKENRGLTAEEGSSARSYHAALKSGSIRSSEQRDLERQLVESAGVKIRPDPAPDREDPKAPTALKRRDARCSAKFPHRA